MIIQMLSAPAVQTSLQIQAKKFDYANWAADMLDVQGFDVDHYFQNMTPDDIKRMQEQNQALAKGQADQNLEATKHQNDLENINEKGTVQAGVALVKKAAESHLDTAQDALSQLVSPEGQPAQ